jgi:hypothetical protein
MLFLHRQKGRLSIGALNKWLSVAEARGASDIISSLSTLPQGDCWVWPAGSDTPVRTHIPEKRTYHPDRRTFRDAAAQSDRKVVDVSKFVEHMQGSLQKIVDEAAANDPRRLKARIAELEREKRLVGNVSADLTAAEGRGYERGFLDGRMQVIAHYANAAFPQVKEALDHLVAAWGKAQKVPDAPALAERVDAAPRPASVPIAPRSAPMRKPIRSNGTEAPLPRGERLCLIAVAQHAEGVTRSQLTVLTGYKRRTRDAYIQRLRDRGYIDLGSDGRVVARGAGTAVLGPDYEPLPVGAALREHWLGRLPEGERRVLEVLIAAFPEPVERSAIDRATEYQRRTRDAYLQRLRARELIELQGSAPLASHRLFDG